MNAPERHQHYPTTERCIGGVTHFDNTAPWLYELDNPYLHGVHAPVLDEIERDQLEVEGELPADLCGAYLRNGFHEDGYSSAVDVAADMGMITAWA